MGLHLWPAASTDDGHTPVPSVPSDKDGPANQAGETGSLGPVLGTIFRGPKGDTGPRGPVEPTGNPGVKGQKGEPGEMRDDHSNQQVAFTVVRTSHLTSTSHDLRLPFQETETLLPGTSFDLGTGTFTCSVPGS
ncbi:complement C1q subcomponent subunit B-like [Patiria miniata]|uniref:C1q domain-containing protein n=1 Tax=Patiria miniata TaxID=46514 RepID=A0A914BLW4_PATMI|nr:complement C1q subcomponent subunit B-like [Patiria miniata]